MKGIKQKILTISLCLALVTLIAILGTFATAGATAELSLSPATKTVNIDDNFNVDVLVNTGGQNVVAVAAHLNYDPTKLEVIGIDTSNSVFTMTIEKTADPTTGMIKLTLGKPTPGVNTASGNVATINFKAIAQASPAYVSFVMSSFGAHGDSDVVLDDRKGTNILGSVKNGAYFIGGGGAQPPTISFTYVPDDYPTIQAAVNVASAGDTIIVRDGTYNENVKVNKRLTIQSENGANCTIVQAANSSDYVFEVTSDYVNISGFTVEGALDSWKAGMYITANYCNISNNNASNNTIGILLEDSNSNIISNNEICSNVYLGNAVGIYFFYSNNNIISNNTCSNNTFGVKSWYSSNNRLINNTILRTGISINGYSLSDFTHEIDVSNTVNGKPIYYWKDVEDGKIPSGAGQVILVNCKNVVVKNQNLNDVGSEGILIAFSSYNIIKNNTCSNNFYGIDLRYSSNNSIFNNICSKNFVSGIHLYTSNNNSIFNNIYSKNFVSGIYLYTSNNNLIYLNDFRNNADNVYYYNESANLWNSTEKITYTHDGTKYTNYLGNYWDDYSGTDTNGDGIGDKPYSIGSDKDNYPLITPWQNHIGVPVTRTNAELFLSPATKTVNVGDSFSVDVLVNTDGQNVVVVGAYLNYDPTKLEVIGIDTSNSVFTMTVEKTADPTTSMIKLAFGKPTPGVNTVSGNVATINFKAIAQASPAYVSFVTDSDLPYITCVCLDDGKPTDILGSVKNGAYFIGGSGAQPPTVISTGTIFGILFSLWRWYNIRWRTYKRNNTPHNNLCRTWLPYNKTHS
jgi:parallel beta-helix repeat protein